MASGAPRLTSRPDSGPARRVRLRTEAYVDKPLVHRIHSGEAFGDGGLVFAMFRGIALAFLTVSGVIVYLTMRRRNPIGLQRVFW